MFTLFTDGGARGNPGPAACAAFLFDSEGKLVSFDAKYVGADTNNVAEYEGLLLGLKLLAKHQAADVIVKMDSELIVKQIRGEYSVKNEGLAKIYKKVMMQLESLASYQMVHVPRAENKFADRLVNIVLDTQAE